MAIANPFMLTHGQDPTSRIENVFWYAELVTVNARTFDNTTSDDNMDQT